MRLGDWIRPPRHLLVLFSAVTTISSVALGWSSWQLVRQDRDLARQRLQEQRESAATLAVGTLQQTLKTIETDVTALAEAPESERSRLIRTYTRALPDDTALVVIRAGRVDGYPAGRFLYYPVVPPVAEIPASTFAAADAAEFREKDYRKAIAQLRATTASAALPIRAESLVRMARNQRKAGQWREAIRTYEDLAQLDVPVDGVPAGLVARAAICDVLAEHDRGDRLAREAVTLNADLQRGHWRVLRPVYDVYSANARRWTAATTSEPDPAATGPSPAALVFSETARAMWSTSQTAPPGSSRGVSRVGDTSVLVVRHTTVDATVALAALPSFVESRIKRKETTTAEVAEVLVTLADAGGQVLVGPAVPSTDYSVRLGAATGLPWTVYAVSAGDGTSGPFTVRRRLVVAGLAAIVLLITGGSYLIGRAVMRELRVARLQSDFVSAVSHEFRSPLTAMRQMSELLVQGRVANDDMRQQFYQALQVESSRLHRLVEGLLKFGRMEAHAMPFQFEPVEAEVFVPDVVTEFRREATRQGYDVELETSGTPVNVNVDREALACALWNLLDNAIKYSPGEQTIWVSLEHTLDAVAIRVRDRGLGVADADRSRIFEKFVRGDRTSSLGVQGTGIGLAVARQIARRHGGDITVDSTPGAGSTFTMFIPVGRETVETPVAGAPTLGRLTT